MAYTDGLQGYFTRVNKVLLLFCALRNRSSKTRSSTRGVGGEITSLCRWTLLHMPLTPKGYPLWPMWAGRGGSFQKEYFFQASGISRVGILQVQIYEQTHFMKKISFIGDLFIKQAGFDHESTWKVFFFFFEFFLVTLTHLVYKITLFTALTLRYSSYTELTSLQWKGYLFLIKGIGKRYLFLSKWYAKA